MLDEIEIAKNVRDLSKMNLSCKVKQKLMHTKDNLINLDSDSIMSEHSDFLEYNA